jgi:predicted DNA-binding transcriptional regulator YafY
MGAAILNRIRKIQAIDHLIQEEKTGSPDDLAEKIGTSVRTTYDFIKFMRSLGAPIKYSESLRSYYYKDGGEFIISFVKEKKADKA